MDAHGDCMDAHLGSMDAHHGCSLGVGKNGLGGVKNPRMLILVHGCS